MQTVRIIILSEWMEKQQQKIKSAIAEDADNDTVLSPNKEPAAILHKQEMQEFDGAEELIDIAQQLITVPMQTLGEESPWCLHLDDKWTPEIGLSKLSGNLLAVLIRISAKIHFLDAGRADKIKISFPAVCRQADGFDGRFEVWQELQYRVMTNDYPQGRLLITPRRNLFTKCATADCELPFCPYIAAAYIRYILLYGGDNGKQQLIRLVCKGQIPKWPNTFCRPAIPETRLAWAKRVVLLGLGSGGTSKKTDTVFVSRLVSRQRYGDPSQFDRDTVLTGTEVEINELIKGTDTEGRYKSVSGELLSKAESAVLAVSIGAGNDIPLITGAQILLEHTGRGFRTYQTDILREEE